MLCLKCQSLGPLLLSLTNDAKHHSTFAELQLAVQEGCRICALFKTALLQEYASDFRCSLLEAETYYRRLDQRDAPEIVNSRGCAFYICPEIEDMDARFAPIEHGLRGILYLRKKFAGEERWQTSGGYPFIGLSFNPGRQVSGTAEIMLAKSWIDDCITCHPLCDAQPLTQLPTRVLDLGTPTDPLRICLVFGQESTAPYAALSHCWGSSQPLKLTLSTIEQFQKHISLSTLPETFKDAVSVTRSLGLRYLWIDSLCIIQDSHSDWESECAKMINVYKNATVTLAGPAAASCDSGFLHNRNGQIHEVVDVLSNGTSAQVILSYHGVDQYIEYFNPEENSPWATRAWILQERLLSRRILYFGSSKMYFECSTNVRLETCHYPVAWDYDTIEMVVKTSAAQLQNNLQRFEYWTDIVSTYSTLLLTMERDRLPALSGIASDFQKATNDQYLAGLWKDDLPRALTWCVQCEKFQPPYLNYIAPSWSWASNSNNMSYVIPSYSIHFRGDLEILHGKTTLAGVNPYGEVKDGYLEVRGRIQHFGVEYRTDPAAPQGWKEAFRIQGYGGNSVATYFPDDISGTSQTKFRITLLYIGKFPYKHAIAMAIETQIGSCNTYKRIGLAYSKDRVERDRLEDSFDSVRSTTLRLV